ncbi:hypothetical protein EV651_1239 [Kribbella sp. VKM Ac-2571]|nr:hypothetical protein EV651_1239 [Kribbella sp. VKM Ac-2571]
MKNTVSADGIQAAATNGCAGKLVAGATRSCGSEQGRKKCVDRARWLSETCRRTLNMSPSTIGATCAGCHFPNSCQAATKVERLIDTLAVHNRTVRVEFVPRGEVKTWLPRARTAMCRCGSTRPSRNTTDPTAATSAAPSTALDATDGAAKPAAKPSVADPTSCRKPSSASHRRVAGHLPQAGVDWRPAGSVVDRIADRPASLISGSMRTGVPKNAVQDLRRHCIPGP